MNVRKMLTAPIESALLAIGCTVAAMPSFADSTPIPAASPVFGLDYAPDGSLLVADAGSGVLELRKGATAWVASLPGATEVAAIGRGDMYVSTSHGFGGDGRLYRVSRGKVREVADISGFEAAVNPDGGIVDSNPFDLALLSGGSVLVADAAANAVVIANARGSVDWVVTLPNEIVSTDHLKQLAGCPGSGAPFCGLPPAMPAQGVATSVAVGPDGAYYVGELKGFPAPTGESRIWRVVPGARHVRCGIDPGCTQVGDGFTSIVDLAFGPDGTLYVVELDEASWAAVEFDLGPVGGTVNACDIATWNCTEVATGLTLPTSVAVSKTGTVSVVTHALIPGNVQVLTLP